MSDPVPDEPLGLRGHLERLAATSLEEDLGGGGVTADLTTCAVVPSTLFGRARVHAKGRGVVCGLEALEVVYARLDERVDVALVRKDGDEVGVGDPLAVVEGLVRPILVGERSALNVIGHLSGIATTVAAFVRAAPSVELTDTRKTLPGLRALQKYAVRIGGGSNHRSSLWDGVLVKDNHIVAAGSISEAVRRARATKASVQVECTSIEEVDQALEAGAQALLLDNRSPEQLRELVTHVRSKRGSVLVEASGGVTMDDVGEIAASGVDRVSIGVFTHSVGALDVSMTLEEIWEA